MVKTLSYHWKAYEIAIVISYLLAVKLPVWDIEHAKVIADIDDVMNI